MKITPDWAPHKQLEADAESFLTSMGFSHGSTTYHDVLPKSFQQLLQRNNDPTSLMVRTRADRVAVHQRIRNVAFQYEAKTNTGKYRNMAVEAIQLAQHVMASRLGVRCLYAYRDVMTGKDAGFWCDNLPPIQRIQVPPGNDGISGVLCIAFPGVPIAHSSSVSGSGDAFCIISESAVNTLTDWRGLIADWLAATEAA